MEQDIILKNTGSIQFNDKDFESDEVNTILIVHPTITKTVDKTTAKSGDVIKYTILIKNPNNSILSNILFKDVIDTTLSQYVTGSFKVNSVVTVPTTTNPLTYMIVSIGANATINLEFSVNVL